MTDLRALARQGASAVLALTFASACSETHALPTPTTECEVDAIVATLDPSLAVVQSFCVELAPGPIGAIARTDGAIDVLHAHASTVGRDSTITLDSLVATPETGAIGARGAPCTTTFTSDEDTATVALMQDLAISPDGALVAWGVRAALPREDSSPLPLPGRWDVARRGDCSVETHPFARVEGVAFASDTRGSHVLVSGGLGGPVYMDGVFLDGSESSRVLAESTPGSIWRLGDAVLVGGVLGHGVMPATLIPLASIRAGVEVQAGEDGVVSGDASAHRFVVLEGRGIVAEAPHSGVARVGLELRSVEVRADALVFGEPSLLAGPEVTAAIPVEGTRRFLLRHAHGLLLVE